MNRCCKAIRPAVGARPAIGPRSAAGRRKGALVFEVVASAALAAAALLLIARVSVAVDRQRRMADDRRLASQTLQNAMEPFALLAPGERAARAAAALPLPAAAARLADAELRAQVVAVDGPVAAQRVTLRIAWRPAPDAEPTGLALTAFFPAVGAAPPGAGQDPAVDQETTPEAAEP